MPRRFAIEWKTVLAVSGILVYFILLSHRGLLTYLDADDLMNLVSLHGYWKFPWWQNVLAALTVVTPKYRPMGDLFYRPLYAMFGFNPLPFRAACFLLIALNIVLFFRLSLVLSRCRESSLLSTLVFGFHAALGNLYLSTGTIYDILCVTFTLATWLVYARVRGQGRALGAKDILCVLLLYGAALDSKEMAASMPLALVLYELVISPRIAPTMAADPIVRIGFWRRALPVLLAGVLTAAYLWVKVPGLSDNPSYQVKPSLPFVLNNAGRYIGMLLFRPASFAPAWLVVVLSLALAITALTRRPVALFGLLYGLTAVLPILVVPPRDGFVLYLPLAGFALLAGEALAAARRAAAHLVPLNETGFLLAAGILLFVIQSSHRNQWMQHVQQPESAIAKTISLIRASNPALPHGARLLFLDDPLPANDFMLLFLIQAAYRDPSLWVERQRNVAAPIDSNEYALFDYLISIRDGKVTEQRLQRISPMEPSIPVSFTPKAVAPGDSLRMRVGGYTDTSVDIEYETALPFAGIHGVALRWAFLDSSGVAQIPISRGTQDHPASIRITAVRVSGDVWRKASGGFFVR